MYFEQFYLGCLAHASYLLGSNGVGVIIDPQRDVDIYLKAAQEHGLTIQHIFETHLHADFVSGHRELSERTAARIYIGADAKATLSHVAVRDGDVFKFGECSIRVLHTPGHTPESICLVVNDPEYGDAPWAVFTGDTLFIGDVGRPDLSRKHTPQQLAGMMFESLHQKVLGLPDATLVYPAHGAGSLCGRNMRADRFSTIGTERLTNYALQIKTRDEFVWQMTANLPSRPAYFAEDAEINRAGAAPLEVQERLRGFTPEEVRAFGGDLVLLDVRPVESFAAGHVPGAISISLSGQFASWAGIVIGLHTPVVLIAESHEKAEEARMRLARVGIENVLGELAGGVDAWTNSGLALDRLEQISVQELYANRSAGNSLQVLDVRRSAEWEARHVAGAVWFALDEFSRKLPELPSDVPVAVHCKGGYRSTIACSLLQRAGYKNVINVIGGFDAWIAANQPVSAEAASATAK